MFSLFDKKYMCTTCIVQHTHLFLALFSFSEFLVISVIGEVVVVVVVVVGGVVCQRRWSRSRGSLVGLAESF